MEYPKFLASSVNPNKLSTTLKGLVPLLIALLPLFGVINIGEGEILELIDALIIAISGAVTLYGAIRKIYTKLAK